ncbi:hypothetical protein GCM10009601_33880 [Streptomyces thermospinosisporus]|uniref:HIT domain-containing protein n=1 Tax=Streptomyces thermospinosisporus TaxID=161482 RepID=A0ABN1YZH4_9ACTN
MHAHVWPRFDAESDDLVGRPVWLYPRERWTDQQFALGPQHEAVREAIGEELDRLAAQQLISFGGLGDVPDWESLSVWCRMSWESRSS